MKRKVGELFNKPIVQGNENVLSSNEILVEQKGNTISLKERVDGEIKEISGGNAGGGGSYRFYSIEGTGDSKPVTAEYLMPSFARVNGMILPAILAYAGNMWESVSAVSVDTSANIFSEGEWKNIGEILDVASSMLQSIGIVEITEEEFYNLNN